ncbi:TIGR03089 family protein [Pilimelia columellifera]
MEGSKHGGTADVAGVFGGVLPQAPATPLLTYLDDARGERFELVALDLADRAARTAALLHDDCRVGPGSRCAVLLPPHWRSAVILLGCWATGAAVEHRPWATAGLAEADHVDAVFVSAERLGSWLEQVPPAWHRFVVGLDCPVGDVPAGYRDLAVAMRGRQASQAPRPVFAAGSAATPDGSTHQQWGSLARAIADHAGLRPGDRVLIDADEAANDHPLRWLLAPLSVGATIVLCARSDRDKLTRHAAEEQATHVWS